MRTRCETRADEAAAARLAELEAALRKNAEAAAAAKAAAARLAELTGGAK